LTNVSTPSIVAIASVLEAGGAVGGRVAGAMLPPPIDEPPPLQPARSNASSPDASAVFFISEECNTEMKEL
jgi:hypothetical protein